MILTAQRALSLYLGHKLKFIDPDTMKPTSWSWAVTGAQDDLLVFYEGKFYSFKKMGKRYLHLIPRRGITFDI